MAKAGRKRKAGERYPGGRLRETFDHGSDRIKAARERYGVHYNTALGRAYAAGMLGDEGLDRYNGGKHFVRVYVRLIGGDAYRCPLDDTPRGGNVIELEPDDRDRRDHDWLFKVMDSLDVAGVRPYLDQLITSAHHDHGPDWLDRILAGGKDPIDRTLLNAAIKALDILAPARRPMGIVAERY